MNERSIKILAKMLSSNEPVSLDILTEEFSVSERTIYNDLIEIESFLSDFGEDLLEREGRNFNIQEMGLAEREQIEFQISKLQLKIREFTPSARIGYQIFILLNSSEYITNQLLADILDVSQSTIKNDRSALQQKLLPYNLMLESKKFKGIRIVGDEKDIRSFLVDLLMENRKKNDVMEIDPFYLDYFDESLFEDVSYIIDKFRTELSIEYTDEAISHLKSSLLVTLKRLNNGKVLSTSSNEKNINVVARDVRGIDLLKEFIGKSIDYELSEDEANREAQYILAKFDRSSYLTSNYILHSDYWVTYQFLINKLITDVSSAIEMNLRMDQELFTSLYNHIHPAVERLKNKTPYTNPLKEEVLEIYSKLYHVVKSKLYEFEEYFQVKFNADEASYVVLLFESAVERNNNEMILPARVILVCQYGISTSALLKEELNKYFNVNVKSVLSKQMFLNQIDELEYDYVISTVKLPSSIEYTLVNPILTTADKSELREILYNKRHLIDADYILNMLDDVITINDYQGAVSKINEMFNYNTNKTIGGEIMLTDVINENLIEIGVKVDNAEGAVRKAGDILYTNNLIEKEYIEAMVDNLEANGPYFVIAPGIAMPHARPEFGVNQIGLSIVVLEEPVKFNHSVNDPVKLIIGLCAIDHQSHLNALADLMGILSDNEKVEKIMNTNDKKDILNIIRGE